MAGCEGGLERQATHNRLRTTQRDRQRWSNGRFKVRKTNESVQREVVDAAGHIQVLAERRMEMVEGDDHLGGPSRARFLRAKKVSLREGVTVRAMPPSARQVIMIPLLTSSPSSAPSNEQLDGPSVLCRGTGRGDGIWLICVAAPLPSEMLEALGPHCSNSSRVQILLSQERDFRIKRKSMPPLQGVVWPVRTAKLSSNLPLPPLSFISAITPR
ncbi:hypothetical protein MMC32_004466 [Xylographa parallela]|nr:hypothetical protein [Xylographa parallela]